jgi:DNA-binding CsgD family transcriptional regulator
VIPSALVDLALQPESVGSARSSPEFSPNCAAVAPSLLASLRRLNALQMEALDAVAFPMFAVLADGYLLFANLAGRTTLRTQQWLRQRSCGRLVAARLYCGSQSLTNALAAMRSGRPTTALLIDGASQRQVVMATLPISTASAPKAGLIWLIPTTVGAVPSESLRVFGLTVAEERVLQQLMAGRALREAAVALKISVHTARNQLKSILHKTGHRTQGQLLALVNRIGSVTCRERL